MFLNTLGVKETMVRWWLTKDDVPKTPKKPIKSINADSYIDNLPLLDSKCPFCVNAEVKYVNFDGVKNLFQLYKKYFNDVKSMNLSPASRKTFTKVFNSKNLRFFKPKNETDICDLFPEHNVVNFEQQVENIYFIAREVAGVFE